MVRPTHRTHTGSAGTGDRDTGGAFESTTAATSLHDPVVVDARPLIAAGTEPFGAIMAAVAGLVPGQELVVLAPFEPVPLEGVLGSEGFVHEAVEIGGGDWRVTFRPAD